MIFFDVVLPVLIVFLIGFLVQKWKKFDIKPISTTALYIMTPALVFRTFYDVDIDMQYFYMVIFSAILLLSLIIINKLYAAYRGYSNSTEAGLILSTAFMNSGNYGAPIILFAYGEAGFAYAISFMVLQSIIMNIFGVYYAAKGNYGLKKSLETVVLMPTTWAVVISLMFNFLPFQAPAQLLQPIDLIAEAAIPTVMLILGMQLAKIPLNGFEWGKVTYSTSMRLLISPLIAFLITLILPLDPLLAKVLIVSSAMPSAATIVMYAVQFQAQPQLVSSTTLVSTLLSILTITTLLGILG